MKKYKLLKKFCDEQVEEVGHVFEIENSEICYHVKYSPEYDNATYSFLAKPHEIPLLINAGYLEEVKEVNFEDARWKEGEIKKGDKYWVIKYSGADWVYWSDSKYDRYCMKTNPCFKTQTAAQAYYESIVGKE